MQPRSVVITALFLAALLAGGLIYVLNNDAKKVALVSPTPSQIALPSMAVTPDPAHQPRITAEAAQTTAPEPMNITTQIKPSAPTGTADWLLPLVTLSIASGATGVIYQLKRHTI